MVQTVKLILEKQLLLLGATYWPNQPLSFLTLGIVVVSQALIIPLFPKGDLDTVLLEKGKKEEGNRLNSHSKHNVFSPLKK